MREQDSLRIAVLGLGAMGSRMAARLMAAGYEVTVWNRTQTAASALIEAGARWAGTPKEAAAKSQAVLAMVRDNDASREVWLGSEGAAGGLAPGALGIEASTLTPDWILELGETLLSKDVSFVEAPVVGSRPQAETGQLICLAGGKRSHIDRARPVLSAFASRVSCLGELGLGAAAKLAVNGFFATQVAAAAEAIHFLRRSGVEDERWLDLFSNLPIVAAPIAGAMKGMALGQFPAMFPVDLVEKDLRYFLEAGRCGSSFRPLANQVQELFAAAVAAGFGADNITGIVQIFDDQNTQLPVEA